jgi:hypothetical protein
LQQPLLTVALTGVLGSPSGRSPAAPARGAYFKAIAGEKLHPDFFRTQDARLSAVRYQTVIVRDAVFASKHSTGTITRTVARGVGTRGLRSFKHQVERNTEATAKLSIAARTGPEFMVTEVQRKSNLGDFNAAKLDSANGVPFAD